jgi:hypothetical protein
MNEDEGPELFDLDPRNLLPFTCEFEPHDPNVEMLPKGYRILESPRDYPQAPAEGMDRE